MNTTIIAARGAAVICGVVVFGCTADSVEIAEIEGVLRSTTHDVTAEEAEGRAVQPSVRAHPVPLPPALCGALGGTNTIVTGILVSVWLQSPWGALASVPFIAWQQAGCPVNVNFIVPVL